MKDSMSTYTQLTPATFDPNMFVPQRLTVNVTAGAGQGKTHRAIEVAERLEDHGTPFVLVEDGLVPGWCEQTLGYAIDHDYRKNAWRPTLLSADSFCKPQDAHKGANIFKTSYWQVGHNEAEARRLIRHELTDVAILSARGSSSIFIGIENQENITPEVSPIFDMFDRHLENIPNNTVLLLDVESKTIVTYLEELAQEKGWSILKFSQD